MDTAAASREPQTTKIPEIDDPDNLEEQEEQLFQEALFEARFEDLPTVKAVRSLIAARGYGERDPLNIFVDVCGKFEAQLTSTSNRQLTAAATMQDAVNKFRDVMLEGAKHWGSSYTLMTELQQQNEAMSGQLLEVITVLQQFIPPLNKAAGEVVRASELIQETSTKTVIIRWVSVAAIFLAGFFAAVALHP